MDGNGYSYYALSIYAEVHNNQVKLIKLNVSRTQKSIHVSDLALHSELSVNIYANSIFIDYNYLIAIGNA